MGKNLAFKAFMLNKGIGTQAELARRCGVTESYISLLVCNRAKPGKNMLRTLARVLRSSQAELKRYFVTS